MATPLAAQTSAPHAPDERALLGEVPSVFAASKYDQPLNEAPADVTVVTRAEILRYGWLTLADVLRGVRSFLVTHDVGGVDISMLAGAKSTYAGRLTVGERIGSREYLLSVTPGRTNGERNVTFPVYPPVHGGLASNGDADWWVKRIGKWLAQSFADDRAVVARVTRPGCGPGGDSLQRS